MVVIDIAHVLQSRNIRETSWMLWGLCFTWYLSHVNHGTQRCSFFDICPHLQQHISLCGDIHLSECQQVSGLTHDIPCCEQCSKLVLLDDCGYCGLYYHHNYHNYIIYIYIYNACIDIFHEVSFPKLVLLCYIYKLSSLSSSNWESPILVDDF